VGGFRIFERWDILTQENGCIELFNGRFRDELLNGEIFAAIAEARTLSEQVRKGYNQERPQLTGLSTPGSRSI